MRRLLFVFLVIPLFLLAKGEEKICRIGFSQCTEKDAWRQAMITEMENNLLLNSNLELIIKGANDNSALQIQQIKELIAADIDVLVVSPNETKPLSAIISEVYKSGIPVIVVDRKIESKDYTQYIGADNYDIGRQAGLYAVSLLGEEGNVMEVWGLPGSSPAMERHNGFVSVLKEYPNIQITSSTTGQWNSEIARTAVKPFLDSKVDIDLVFAHNDFMALGAYDAFCDAKILLVPPILGVDGLFGKQGGIQAVTDGKLAATFLYPSGGNEIMASVLALMKGETLPKELSLPTVAIDRNNAEAINSQMGQIIELGSRIKQARTVLEEQEMLYESQGFRLRLLAFVLLGIFIIIVGVAIAYHRLRQQKGEIDKQNAELQHISALLEEATQTKLRFFTNISHEFRTPITLLIGPLEDLLASKQHTAADLKIFRLMHRNAKRLLRLVNQLMDLRTLDNNKMKLRANQYDIVKFVRHITESFEPLAQQHDIDFEFDSEFEAFPLWFDRDKLDKSIFNLLSNAFKFTPDGGGISVQLKHVKYSFDADEVSALNIAVTDTGVGMSAAHAAYVFDRFYKTSEGSQGALGSGIGLALTKELVELHQGQITVSSVKDKGTTFDIYLKQGDKHIDSEVQLLEDDGYTQPSFQIDSGLSSTPVVDVQTSIDVEKPLLLIVEDNDDVRDFVRSGLEPHYRIMEAENGKLALDKIEEQEPDLIISDVMMPEMDGIELLKHIKNTRETCHIPVVILSARNASEHKLQGLSEGADSYIPKPFNSEHLRIRVQKLIESRQKLRSYYQQSIELPVQEEGNTISILDKKFLREARKAIEDNMTNTQFGVEELSQACYISRVHLYRKIKHLTGLSATEFMRHIKLKKAAAMLIDSGKSSSEVAFECGFSSPSYFAKRFKEHFKVSPTEYVASRRK